MANLTKEQLEIVKKSSEFINTVSEAVRERGVIYNFTCPKCGGTIIASRATNNGHLHMRCDNCDFSVIE